MSSLSALVVRILLCLSLILNGSGYAVASTKMQLTHVAAATQQAHMRVATESASGAPCHSMQDASVVPSADAVQAGAHDKHGKAADCCQPAQCVCDCLQHASAAIFGLQIPPPLIVPAPSTHPMQVGHAAPMLANPIRPPIG